MPKKQITTTTKPSSMDVYHVHLAQAHIDHLADSAGGITPSAYLRILVEADMAKGGIYEEAV